MEDRIEELLLGGERGDANRYFRQISYLRLNDSVFHDTFLQCRERKKNFVLIKITALFPS